MRTPRLALFLVGLACSAALAAAEDVRITASWTVGPSVKSSAPPMIVPEGSPRPTDSALVEDQKTRQQSQKVGIRIGAVTLDGKEVPGEVFNPNSKAADLSSFWIVTARDKDGKTQQVKTTLVARRNSIVLFPDKTPDPKLTYTVAPSTGSLDGVFISRYRIVNARDFAQTALVSTNLPADIAYVNGNKALEPSIAFKTGKDSTASLKLFYGFQQWEDGKHIRFQASLDAEGTYKPKKKGNYLSKIEGEVDALYLFPDFRMPSLGLHALQQLGLDARVESDQMFDNTSGVLGISSWTAINGSSIQAISRALCLFGDLEISAPSPVFTLNYELVQSLKRDSVTKSRDLETTTDRIRAHLFWSIKLAHKLPLEQIWDRLDTYDVDFVIDSGFAYDIRNGEFAPDINLSLELSPTAVDKSKPSLVLTYVNGKTKAHLENYNAILAGVKLPF